MCNNVVMIGVLLAATAIDARGCLFPLAHAVVDAENHENALVFSAAFDCRSKPCTPISYRQSSCAPLRSSKRSPPSCRPRFPQLSTWLLSQTS